MDVSIRSQDKEKILKYNRCIEVNKNEDGEWEILVDDIPIGVYASYDVALNTMDAIQGMLTKEYRNNTAIYNMK